MRSRVSWPISTMNSGIRGIVKTMIAPEIQSSANTATTTTTRHDQREHELGQVQREVVVQRVQPARGQHRQLARALR